MGSREGIIEKAFESGPWRMGTVLTKKTGGESRCEIQQLEQRIVVYISVFSLEAGLLRILNSVPGQILYNCCANSVFFPQVY